MKYNRKTIKNIESECNLCRGSFLVWLNTLNFDREKEEGIRNHLYNHCPSCRVSDKLKKS